MAKENVLPLLLLLLITFLPTSGFADKGIKTTQYTIVIDPGHGGKDNGIISPNGMQEKNITLKLAEKTARLLENRYNALLTRTADIDLSFRERIFIANRDRADFFLSVHLHHSGEPSVFLYYFNPTESYPPLTAASSRTWKSQALIHQPESKNILHSFFRIFSADKKNHQLFSTGAPVKILEGAAMPSVLIEPLSFSTLPIHTSQIDDILDEYALLILKSIDHYFSNN